MHNHCDNRKYLYKMGKFKIISKHDITENCMDLQLLFPENNDSNKVDIDAIEMINTLVAVS